MSLHSKPHSEDACTVSCNLPPALLVEWQGSFMLSWLCAGISPHDLLCCTYCGDISPHDVLCCPDFVHEFHHIIFYVVLTVETVHHITCYVVLTLCRNFTTWSFMLYWLWRHFTTWRIMLDWLCRNFTTWSVTLYWLCAGISPLQRHQQSAIPSAVSFLLPIGGHPYSGLPLMADCHRHLCWKKWVPESYAITNLSSLQTQYMHAFSGLFVIL